MNLRTLFGSGDYVTIGSITPEDIGVRSESRVLSHDSLPFLIGNPVHSGEHVSPETALQVATVAACVRLLSSTVASLPLITYRRDGDSRTRATDHYLYDLLKNKVNPHLSAYLWRQHAVTCLLLYGNSYTQIVMNGRAQVIGLYPLNPSRMTVVRMPDHSLKYQYQHDTGTITFSSSEILHIRYKVDPADPYVGRPALDAARQSIGVAMAAEKHMGRVFANSMSSTHVFEFPDGLEPEQAEAVKQAILSQHQGAINAGRPVFMFGGGKISELKLNHNDLQFAELRRQTVLEICRAFGVPPHAVGELDRATFSNVEHQSLEFLRDSIRPILNNIQAEINVGLLSDREREVIFTEFLLDDFMKADIKTRYEAYSRALGTGVGFAKINEIRKLENLPPVDEGETLYIPRQNTPEVNDNATD